MPRLLHVGTRNTRTYASRGELNMKLRDQGADWTAFFCSIVGSSTNRCRKAARARTTKIMSAFAVIPVDCSSPKNSAAAVITGMCTR